MGRGMILLLLTWYLLKTKISETRIMSFCPTIAGFGRSPIEISVIFVLMGHLIQSFQKYGCAISSSDLGLHSLVSSNVLLWSLVPLFVVSFLINIIYGVSVVLGAVGEHFSQDPLLLSVLRLHTCGHLGVIRTNTELRGSCKAWMHTDLVRWLAPVLLVSRNGTTQMRNAASSQTKITCRGK